MKKYLRINSFVISFLAIFAGLLVYIAGIPFLERLELATIDLRFHLRGTQPAGKDIVLAVIDEKSIRQEGKWVWPRSKFADLVNRLSDAGASVTGFDIGFLEPDQNTDRIRQVIAEVRNRIEEAGTVSPKVESDLAELSMRSDLDRELADAIRKSRSRVVLGYFFHTGSESTGSSELPANVRDLLAGSEYRIKSYTPDASDDRLISSCMPQANIQSISDAAAYSGHFNMEPDPDGVVRELPVAISCNERIYAPLALVSASAFLDRDLAIRIGGNGVKTLRIGKQSIPVTPDGKVLINYRGPETTFPAISVTDILHGNFPPDMFRNRIVLVGATAVGIYDLRVTPFDSIFPGLEIHANVLDNILKGDFLSRPSWTPGFEIAAIILLPGLLGFLLKRSEIRFGIFFATGILAGYAGFAQYLFARHQVIVNMVYPLFAIMAVYMGITLHQARQRKFIKTAFSHYLAPSVIKKLLESPESLVLGGEKRYITAFFSDIRNFTSISEQLTPEELVELLNRFLTEMTDIILRYEGTVDKFEGDAIIAFFGAPNHLENHAQMACRAALDMQKRLAELRGQWIQEGFPALHMRIGMCSGDAVVGNMGSMNRMDYTMIGDTVNTAARLEGINKFYGTGILVSESTIREIPDDIVGREVDRIAVVGRKIPVKVYELAGYREEVDDSYREAIENYRLGLEAYRNRDWEQAAGLFEKALSLRPEDGPGRLLLERCRNFELDPPPEEWNGVFIATSK